MTFSQRSIRVVALALAALIGYQVAPELIFALIVGAVVWLIFLRPWSTAPVRNASDSGIDEWSSQMFPSQDTPWANDLRRNGVDTPSMSEHMNVTGNEDRDEPSRW